MQKAITVKGAENYRVEKIAAHQTRERRARNTAKENHMRARNEGADKLAVEGAKANQIPAAMIEERKQHINMCQEVQVYLMEIAMERGRITESIGSGKNKFELRNEKAREIAAMLEARYGGEPQQSRDQEEVEMQEIWDQEEMDCIEQEKIIKEIMSQTKEGREKERDKGVEEEEEKEEEKNETEEERNFKLTQRREIAWPLHWWEPRVTGQEDLTIMVEGPEKEVKLHITDGWNMFPIEALEPMLWFWTTAEWDLNDENLIPIDKVEESGSDYTAWIVAAADFYYLTGVTIDTLLTDKYGRRSGRGGPQERG